MLRLIQFSSISNLNGQFVILIPHVTVKRWSLRSRLPGTCRGRTGTHSPAPPMPGPAPGGRRLTTGQSMWITIWPRTPCPRLTSRGSHVTEATCHAAHHAWQGPGSPRTSRVTWRRTSGSQSTSAALSRALFKVIEICYFKILNNYIYSMNFRGPHGLVD